MSDLPQTTTGCTSKAFGVAVRSLLGGFGFGILVASLGLRQYEVTLAGAIMMSTSVALITLKEQP